MNSKREAKHQRELLRDDKGWVAGRDKKRRSPANWAMMRERKGRQLGALWAATRRVDTILDSPMKYRLLAAYESALSGWLRVKWLSSEQRRITRERREAGQDEMARLRAERNATLCGEDYLVCARGAAEIVRPYLSSTRVSKLADELYTDILANKK